MMRLLTLEFVKKERDSSRLNFIITPLYTKDKIHVYMQEYNKHREQSVYLFIVTHKT